MPYAQVGSNIDRETAGDKFGEAISLSADGSIVAIGAPENDGNGSNSGHVRVFKNINNNWIQIGSDIDGEFNRDNFGEAISLSADGSIVAIGASQNDGSGSNSGHVRVFKNVNNNWVQIGSDIDGKDRYDYSGKSLSLSADGSIVAIGAPSEGQVRIFQNINDNWVKIGSDIIEKTRYGESGEAISLSQDGSIIAIGGSGTHGGGWKSGHIRVFQNINNNWIQIGTNIDGDGQYDYFGSSLSTSSDGSIIAIGKRLKGEVQVVEILGNDVGQTYRLSNIRDYDGNPHGLLGDASTDIITGYKYQGKLDVNNDGIEEAIYTNKISGRWVTASMDPLTGEIKYGDHGQGKTTRVVGIYEDPLVQSGVVEKDSVFDGSRTFINDLKLDNLVLRAADDFDRDGFQEVYWSKVDNTAYLRAVMHADGNIQYANYQNLTQMTDYLTSHGFADTVALIA